MMEHIVREHKDLVEYTESEIKSCFKLVEPAPPGAQEEQMSNSKHPCNICHSEFDLAVQLRAHIELDHVTPVKLASNAEQAKVLGLTKHWPKADNKEIEAKADSSELPASIAALVKNAKITDYGIVITKAPSSKAKINNIAPVPNKIPISYKNKLSLQIKAPANADLGLWEMAGSTRPKGEETKHPSALCDRLP
jgi:hypothetical protein